MNMSKQNQDSEMLTSAEVAKRVGVSPVTVRSWVSKGWLTSYATAGGHNRFLWSDVEKITARKKFRKKDDSSVKLLVIDDDELFRSYLVDSIETYYPDAIIRDAYDSFQAGIELATFRPNIIFLDYNLPGFNGLHVCNLIRSNEDFRSCKIIVISGYINEVVHQQFINAGANSVIQKPIPTQKIKEIVSSLGQNME